MYFVFKLTVIILLLYLKSIGLNATPIDRNKNATAVNMANNISPKFNSASKKNDIVEETSTGSGSIFNNTNNNNINNNMNNNSNHNDNNKNHNNNINNNNHNDNKKNHNDNNNHNNNITGDNNYSNLFLTTTTTTTTTTTIKNPHYQPDTIESMSTNLTTIELTNNKYSKQIGNTSQYFYYELLKKKEEDSENLIVDNSKNTETVNELEHETEPNLSVTLTIEADNLTSDPTTNSETITSPTTAKTARTLPTFLINAVSAITNNPLNPDKPDGDNTESELDLNLGDSLQEKINNSDIDRFLLKYDSDNGNTCLLDDIKDYLMWWTYTNGSLRESNLNFTTQSCSLDLSFHNITHDDSLYRKTRALSFVRGRQIIAFSAAHNNLTTVPYRTLSMMNSTLRFLTLKGNQFNAHTQEQESNGIAWATFPPLPALIELDISNCQIEYVIDAAFQNLTNLRRLYMSHNKMLTIPFDTFQYVPGLQYLDLSFTNVLDFDYQITYPTLEAIINLVYGVKIQQYTFKYLPDLEYLDLSHTKLTRNSAVAITHLGEKLRFLSLCYTAFPMVGNALFKNTALVGLDLSGNPYAAYNLIDDAFEGVADTLQYLYFERSNIKDLAWATYLQQLRVLGLSGNNINSVSLETFEPLRSLQILDLSTNHIGNWYNRAFTNNEHLRVLNLRDNNINIITSEMLIDFQLLDYLSIGDNNFVCDCLLRDLVDVAAANNKEAECSANSVRQGAQEMLAEHAEWVGEYVAVNASKLVDFLALGKQKRKTYPKQQKLLQLDDNSLSSLNDDIATELVMRRFVPNLERSFTNMRRYNRLQRHLKMRFISHFKRVFKLDSSSSNGAQCREPDSVVVYNKLNGSALKFQLLDYQDEHYWCFNETERMHFVQLNCSPRTFAEDIAEQLHTLTNYVVGSVVGVLALTLIGVCIYLKRWHIHYYYSSLKSAALWSAASKDNDNILSTSAAEQQDPSLVYDIFISYCQNDRQWVLEELLPNVEETGDISICMHERDFQIGLTILDNIMSCMDRSRALMLVISSNFLLSHWCQFEMHLAQHRIFEVSKEQLILVFLEDIPRSKRPKSLQYLMEVKTYIKWPIAKRNKQVRPEERKLFWRRLRRSLENIGLQYGNESRA